VSEIVVTSAKDEIMTISLRPITHLNWITCINLRPTEEQQQRSFVSPNTLSLAQAYGEPWWTPLAIYADETMVGFLMFGCWPEGSLAPEYGSHEPPRGPGIYYLARLMIDGRYQGRGYARQALEILITQLKAQPEAMALEVSYDLNNEIMAHLCRHLGFEPTGVIEEGEIRARLPLRNRA
jgi:diamine N-acetyltransferase